MITMIEIGGGTVTGLIEIETVVMEHRLEDLEVAKEDLQIESGIANLHEIESVTDGEMTEIEVIETETPGDVHPKLRRVDVGHCHLQRR